MKCKVSAFGVRLLDGRCKIGAERGGSDDMVIARAASRRRRTHLCFLGWPLGTSSTIPFLRGDPKLLWVHSPRPHKLGDHYASISRGTTSLSPHSSSCRPPASCSACAWPCRRSTSADAAAAPPLAARLPSPRPPSPPVRRRPRRRRAPDAPPPPRTSSSRRQRRIPDGTTPTDAARSPPLRPRPRFG